MNIALPQTAQAVVVSVFASFWIAVAIYVLVISGPSARINAAEKRAAEIELETTSVCGKMGFQPKTPVFQACSDGLNQVRLQERERLAAQSQWF